MTEPPDVRTVSWREWSCTMRVTVQTTQARELDAAVASVASVLAEVARSADRFHPGSDVSRINAGCGTLVPVRPLTVTLVDLALAGAMRTGGACDPTVGSALRAAGYVDDIDELTTTTPTAGPALPSAGWRSVRLDHTLRRVGVRRDGWLDLGATAKAWAADEAAWQAFSRIGRPVLVSLGGDLAAQGGGRPWQVEVAEREGDPAEQVELTSGGLATSSTTGRRWTSTLGARHHLIDPATGSPASGPWRTSTVWAPTALKANEASTAALVLGDRAIGWLAEHGHVARLVDHTGTATYVGAWPASGRSAA